MPKRLLSALRSATQIAWGSACAAACVDVYAQDNSAPLLPSVTVTAKANPDPVEKSYRKMIRGMDLFEKQHAVSPNAALRFKLLPRRRETDMGNIELEILGSTVDFYVPVAPDSTLPWSASSRPWTKMHR